MTSAISFHDLKKTYRTGTKALQGLSLTVREGDFFGLLGLNGAGKTTSINVIAGLVRPSSGKVLVRNFDVMKQYRQAHRLVGIAPQEIVLDSRFLNVHQILVYNAGYFGIKKKEAIRRSETLLDELGLWEKRNANVQELSGGMKRRLNLAKALIHDPPILILDEPTAGADVVLRRQIWKKMKLLNAQGKTILLTTHYLEEAEELCNEIAIVHHGKVACRGTPDELIQTSIPDRVVIKTDPPLSSIPVTQLQENTATIVDGMLQLDGSLQDATVLEILNILPQRGFSIRSVEVKKARLEDVFLELTKDK